METCIFRSFPCICIVFHERFMHFYVFVHVFVQSSVHFIDFRFILLVLFCPWPGPGQYIDFCVHFYAFTTCIRVVEMFMSLVYLQVCCRRFLHKNACPDLLTMSILEIMRICRICLWEMCIYMCENIQKCMKQCITLHEHL